MNRDKINMIVDELNRISDTMNDTELSAVDKLTAMSKSADAFSAAQAAMQQLSPEEMAILSLLMARAQASRRKLIESSFMMFRAQAIPHMADKMQIDAMRLAFFSGFAFATNIFKTTTADIPGVDDDEVTALADDTMDGINAELERWVVMEKFKSSKPAGNA